MPLGSAPRARGRRGCCQITGAVVPDQPRVRGENSRFHSSSVSRMRPVLRVRRRRTAEAAGGQGLRISLARGDADIKSGNEPSHAEPTPGARRRLGFCREHAVAATSPARPRGCMNSPSALWTDRLRVCGDNTTAESSVIPTEGTSSAHALLLCQAAVGRCAAVRVVVSVRRRLNTVRARRRLRARSASTVVSPLLRRCW